jgi:hypothetical protein
MDERSQQSLAEGGLGGGAKELGIVIHQPRQSLVEGGLGGGAKELGVFMHQPRQSLVEGGLGGGNLPPCAPAQGTSTARAQSEISTSTASGVRRQMQTGHESHTSPLLQ